MRTKVIAVMVSPQLFIYKNKPNHLTKKYVTHTFFYSFYQPLLVMFVGPSHPSHIANQHSQPGKNLLFTQ